MNANELADKLAFEHIAGDDSGAFRCKLQDTLRQQVKDIAWWKSQYEQMCRDFRYYQQKYRQQQAEIEALKKEAALQRLSDFTQEAESFDRTASHMAGEYVSYNEPVAWMREDGTLKFKEGEYFAVGQPFYTHPAKELTMTFEEMYPIAEKHLGHAIGLYNWKIFGDAILRKAQEK